ncbi:MAG: hypothetical protein JJE47_15905 [Acidimicrobiia bacterium]|nr:hypothetical protein [Acidimicrobiia bacterium]
MTIQPQLWIIAEPPSSGPPNDGEFGVGSPDDGVGNRSGRAGAAGLTLTGLLGAPAGSQSASAGPATTMRATSK